MPPQLHEQLTVEPFANLFTHVQTVLDDFLQMTFSFALDLFSDSHYIALEISGERQTVPSVRINTSNGLL